MFRYAITYAALFACVLFTIGEATYAEEDAAAGKANAPGAEAAGAPAPQYELRYKFHAGETLRYEVEHLATVDTRIAGNSQQTKSRSGSTKVWEFAEVDDDKMKFRHSVVDVDMWQQVSGRQEVRYNSLQDETPPAEYEHVAASLGKPLAVVTINASGKILARENRASQPDLGFGGLVVPLPEGQVALGHVWTVPDEIKIRERDGRVKLVSVRLRFELEAVKTGVATISVRTQVMTPINDARLKSQLIQQLSHGEIKFDIDAGRVLSKRLDWDENVVGFNGPDSNMKYLARFTETLIASEPAQTADARAGKTSGGRRAEK